MNEPERKEEENHVKIKAEKFVNNPVFSLIVSTFSPHSQIEETYNLPLKKRIYVGAETC